MNRQRNNNHQSLTLKLVIPASHCGSIIGKSGCKIKEIRDLSCANVQVGSEMLPMSTERIVSVTGNPDSISQAIYQVCLVLIECTLAVTKGIHVSSNSNSKIIHVQGVQEAVSLAQYLINMCIELQKTNANSADNPEPGELNNAIAAFMTSSANTSLIEKTNSNPCLNECSCSNHGEPM
ncbi:hypothetical protein WDU94_004838 [Cyamophila willieti]